MCELSSYLINYIIDKGYKSLYFHEKIGKPFRLHHYWDILQHGEKWKHFNVLRDKEMEYPSPMSNPTPLDDDDTVDSVPETQDIPNTSNSLRKQPTGNKKVKTQNGKSPLGEKA